MARNTSWRERDAFAIERIIIAYQGRRGIGAYTERAFHTHGFMAEEINAQADEFLRRAVERTGWSNAPNGADRISDGVAIQTKYCRSAARSLGEAFGADGRYRYPGQRLEVPRDQFEECVEKMAEKIRAGCVPGVSDPLDAERLIKRGVLTYRQAVKAARAGSLIGVGFDAYEQRLTCALTLGLSAAFFASQLCYERKAWRIDLDDAKDIGRRAAAEAIKAGASGVIRRQIARTGLYAKSLAPLARGMGRLSNSTAGRFLSKTLARAEAGRRVAPHEVSRYGAKFLRGQSVLFIATQSAQVAPDLYRAIVTRSTSWSEVLRNVSINVSIGVAGIIGGGIGAAGGSFLGPIGALGGAVAGSTGAGGAAGHYARRLLDRYIQSDADAMLELVQSEIAALAEEHLMNQAETEALVEAFSTTAKAKWFRAMYACARGLEGEEAAAARLRFAHRTLAPMCEAIVNQRPRLSAPETFALPRLPPKGEPASRA
jgi:hypothetical protein